MSLDLFIHTPLINLEDRELCYFSQHHFTWIYLLKTKNEVTQHFPCFYSMVLTQFNTKIKSIRLDNALELAFIDFFFREKGIIPYHSCVDTPKKIQLLNVNTNTFSMSQGHFIFNQLSRWFIGIIVFLLQFIR